MEAQAWISKTDFCTRLQWVPFKGFWSAVTLKWFASLADMSECELASRKTNMGLDCTVYTSFLEHQCRIRDRHLASKQQKSKELQNSGTSHLVTEMNHLASLQSLLVTQECTGFYFHLMSKTNTRIISKNSFKFYHSNITATSQIWGECFKNKELSFAHKKVPYWCGWILAPYSC